MRLSQQLLGNPNLDYVQKFTYLSSAGEVALAEKNYPGAIRYFEKAIALRKVVALFVKLLIFRVLFPAYTRRLGMYREQKNCREALYGC